MGLIPDVAAGALITSAWGNAIRNATVQRFANAAERAAQWTTPPKGAVSELDDWTPGVLHFYDGTYWKAEQRGAVRASTSPGAELTVTLPKPFVALEGVTFSGTGSFSWGHSVLMSYNPDLTTASAIVVFVWWFPANGPYASALVDVVWRAFGRTS